MSGGRTTSAASVRDSLKRLFAKRLGITRTAAGGVMGQSTLQDKLYELQALLATMDRLPGGASR
jgi:hypothetical protein